MRQLRSFFTFVMIAVMLIGAMDANAKTKRSKGKKSKSKTTKTTKSQSSWSSDDFYDLEFFQEVVKFANTQTPMDLDDGLVIKSITMEGTKLFYNVTTSDEEMCEIIKENPDLFNQIMKYAVLKEMKDTFDDDEILNAIIKLGITINYRFYDERDFSHLVTITVTGKELKSI